MDATVKSVEGKSSESQALENVSNQTRQSKGTRGGYRKGAGRKPSTIKGILKKLPKPSAELIFQEINFNHRLIELANSDNEVVAAKVCMFLWEQVCGKAKQAVEMSGPNGGPIEHVDLGNLSNGELEQVRQIIESAAQSSVSSLG